MNDPLAFLGSASILDDRQASIQKIKLIIRVRWFIAPTVFLLLIVASLFGLSSRDAFSSDQLIFNGLNTLVILGLNSIYTLLIRRLTNVKPLIYFQLFLDALHFTLTIYKTGGLSSPLSFLYFAVIFAGAVLVSGRASYIAATMTAVLFSIMNLLEMERAIPHQDYFIPLSGLSNLLSYVILSWLFNLVAMYVMATLASFLTGQIRSRNLKLQQDNNILDRKISTLLMLYRTAKALSTYTSVREVVDYLLSELIEFLVLDRALLYVNIEDDHLHLYQVKHSCRQGVIPKDREQNLHVDIPLEEGAGLTAMAALNKQAYNIRHPEQSDLINKELAKKISPIDMVTKNSPPSLILHGKVDAILPYQGSVLMKKKADEVGADLSLVIVEGAGHGFKGDGISPSLKEIIKTVSDFFLDHFK